MRYAKEKSLGGQHWRQELLFSFGGGELRINFFKYFFVCFQTNHVNKLILKKEPLRGGF
jgi:hypothetical protein